MSGEVFVDANVLVYRRDATEKKKQTMAQAWLTYLWQQRLGRTSVQAGSELDGVRIVSPFLELPPASSTVPRRSGRKVAARR